jgi:hypothetical protein
MPGGFLSNHLIHQKVRNISFAMTTDQVRNQTKTVTRRNGWRFLNQGDKLQPIEKGQGLKKGEKVVRIGEPITVIKLSVERLDTITQEDVRKEGFPQMTPAQFVELYCKANKCQSDHPVTRIEFDWLPF